MNPNQLKKKIGLFGGTFDPLHYGHLSLAVDMQENHMLHEVWFFPTHINPFKQEKKITPSSLRLEMVAAVLKNYPLFKVRDDEIKRGGVSFAIDTVVELRKEYSREEVDFFIILGSDAAEGLMGWKEILRLQREVSFLVGLRPGTELQLIDFDKDVSANVRRGVTKTRPMQISSTEIRERVKNHVIYRHLVPEKVVDTIQKHQLYL